MCYPLFFEFHVLLIKVDFFFLHMTTWAKVKQGWLPRHKTCHQEVLSCIIYIFHDYLHFQNFPHIEVKMAGQAQKKPETGPAFLVLCPFSLGSTWSP